MTKTIIPLGTMLLMTAGLFAAAPLPEHPRPDFQRPAWLNLNGAWYFEFDPDNVGETEGWFEPSKHKFTRQITVPFPWESPLSGIGDTEYQGVAWYHIKAPLPDEEEWKGRDGWLVVGACDFKAKVWINGKPAGEHVGGYTPFDINLSPFAKPGDVVSITIRVEDTTDRRQPTGKQVGWYTRTSGIWQTVYLEARSKSFIRNFRVQTPLGEPAHARYQVVAEQPRNAQLLMISSPDGEFKAVTQKRDEPSDAPFEVQIPIEEPQLWSPDSPKLYTARLQLFGFDGKVLDTVDSYFGIREIKTAPAPGRDYEYIYLNGKPVYLRGALHQSFHPEGIYQYPSDAAIRRDYELCKHLGINFLRIHIKAPVPRELYWADKLGVLIQQDMPNYWDHDQQAQEWYEQMLPAVIDRDFNHPAIFSWVDFNETWGIEHGGYSAERQEWVEQIYRRTKELDPTRLVEDNSPCRYDHVATDINSWHFYINDYQRARTRIGEVVEKTFPGSTFNYIGGRKQGTAPLINSEYGGISAGSGDQDISWCFKFLTNELRLHDKICGYIYTELSDIEWEHNGFANYDRSAKEFGYGFWHPGISVSDLNAADFVVIDAPPMIVLKPDEQRDVPIKISHWSDRPGENLSLRYRIDSLDGFGERITGTWESRPARWEPFKVIDQPTIRLDAAKAGSGIVGSLLVELLDKEEVVARNYVNLLVDRGPLPRVQSVNEDTAALRFGPMDFAKWTFESKPQGPQKPSTEKLAGLGSGAVEYVLQIPEGVVVDRLEELTLLAELASKAGDEKLDWPARKKPGDYPQTDVKKWPSNVSIYVNGSQVGSVLLADDPADARGALSHHRGLQGSYGTLVRHTVRGPQLDAVRAALARDRTLRIRLEVPGNAQHKGGLAVFSQNVGCYPVDPTVLLTFDGPHGLADDYASDKPVAKNAAQ